MNFLRTFWELWKLTVFSWELSWQLWELTVCTWELSWQLWKLTVCTWELSRRLWKLTVSVWELPWHLWKLTVSAWKLFVSRHGWPDGPAGLLCAPCDYAGSSGRLGREEGNYAGSSGQLGGGLWHDQPRALRPSADSPPGGTKPLEDATGKHSRAELNASGMLFGRLLWIAKKPKG